MRPKQNFDERKILENSRRGQAGFGAAWRGVNRLAYGITGQGEAGSRRTQFAAKDSEYEIGNMESEICPRFGTKFEVDNYCERGHTWPRLDPYIEHATSTEALPDLPDETEQLREQLAEEREKVEELIKLLAIAQEQQESLVTCLKAVRSFVASDVEICAIIDTASAEFMAK